MKRHTSLVLLLGCSALLLSGCGKKDMSNTVLVYTALEDDQYPLYIEDFKKANADVQVTVVRKSTEDVMAGFLAEGESGEPQADVIWGVAATALVSAKEKNLLEAYAPAGLKDIVPKFRDPAEPPLWVGMDAFMTAFCVNTIELKNKGLTMPKSFNDLLQPGFKGQIVMPNPTSSGTGYLTVNGLLQSMGEEKGWAYLDALHENIAQYVPSGSKPCTMASQGEFMVGISFDFRGFKEKNGGKPVEIVFPSEGSGWDVEASSLVKKKVVKPGAKKFLDWAISKSAQALYANNVGVVSLKGGSKVLPGYPVDTEMQMIKNDFEWASKERKRILDEWTKRYDGKTAKGD